MKTVIVSGYFNPLHGGHLNLIEWAKSHGDRVVVIVNNDKQQLLKKGKIILDESNRMRLMNALRDVDDVVLSIDEDPPIINTIRIVAEKYKGDELMFANGGDRNSGQDVPETAVCQELNIEMAFEAGDSSKFDSSTRINQATGAES
jgi:cytidyltransferase-like protein